MLNSRFPKTQAIPKAALLGAPLLLSLLLATACSGGSSTPTPSGMTSTTAPSATTSAAASPGASEWRETEYAKISRLRGGMTLDYFRNVLGAPMFVKTSADGRFTQSLFQGRSY